MISAIMHRSKLCSCCYHPKFKRPRKRAFLARVERLLTGRTRRKVQVGPKRYRLVWDQTTPPRIVTYWVVRRTKRPQIVLPGGNLGRRPEDPVEAEKWLAKVRRVLTRYGITPEEMTKEPRRLPLQTFVNRDANSPGGERASKGRQVRPRGTGPNYGMKGSVPSRFKK